MLDGTISGALGAAPLAYSSPLSAVAMAAPFYPTNYGYDPANNTPFVPQPVEQSSDPMFFAPDDYENEPPLLEELGRANKYRSLSWARVGGGRGRRCLRQHASRTALTPAWFSPLSLYTP